MKRKKHDLKAQVESQLSDMLESKEEPSEGRMKLLKLGITMLAVNAKLEENEYGEFFRDDPAASPEKPEKRPQPRTRERANGEDEPESEFV